MRKTTARLRELVTRFFRSLGGAGEAHRIPDQPWSWTGLDLSSSPDRSTAFVLIPSPTGGHSGFYADPAEELTLVDFDRERLVLSEEDRRAFMETYSLPPEMLPEEERYIEWPDVPPPLKTVLTPARFLVDLPPFDGTTIVLSFSDVDRGSARLMRRRILMEAEKLARTYPAFARFRMCRLCQEVFDLRSRAFGDDWLYLVREYGRTCGRYLELYGEPFVPSRPERGQ